MNFYNEANTLKNKILDYFVVFAGFLYAIRKGKNPFSVEIIKKDKIYWSPQKWYNWIDFIPRS